MLATPALAGSPEPEISNCSISTSVINNLQKQLAIVIALPDANGGIFKPIACGQP